jgi:hypothetical protein
MPKMMVWKVLLAFAEHLAKVFQPHPSENKPEEEKELTQLWRPHINLNHQSIFSKQPKCKKSSTA